jgi:hypothetical protein
VQGDESVQDPIGANLSDRLSGTGAEAEDAGEASSPLHIGTSIGSMPSWSGELASPLSSTASLSPSSPPSSTSSMPHPRHYKTKRRRKGLLAIVIALVLLICTGSVGTFFFHAREQAHKTTAAQTYPAYLSGNGTLAFFDPLSQEGKWHPRDAGAGGLCQFTGGAYHVSELYRDYFGWCLADGIFSGNFAFEVQLTITQGDCGGMTFRDDSNGHFYKFVICQNGTYMVNKYADYSYTNSKLLQVSNSSAIRTGLGQQNKIAVVAAGSKMIFYVNEQQIDQEQDDNNIPGKIALIANPYYHSTGDHATVVAFSNARLWTL